MQTVDDVRSAAGTTPSRARPVDLHFVGAGLGERELLERALLGMDSDLEVRPHADVREVLQALTETEGRAMLVVLDAEDERAARVTADLRALRARAEVRAVPVIVIVAEDDADAVVALYQAGASAVVHRSRFVDVWLRALQDIVRFWAGTAVLPSAGPNGTAEATS